MSFIGRLVSFLSALVLRGWTLSVLWGWFLCIAPLNFPPLGTMRAAGLLTVLWVVLFRYQNVKEGIELSPRQEFYAALTSIALQCALALGFGYLLHVLIPHLS